MTTTKEERHARVGPAHLWKAKREFQIAFLRQQELKPDDFLLDIGCGTLRGGIPIIEYLNAGNYYGFDVRSEVIDEARSELREEKLEHKNATLLTSEDINLLRLDRQFDVVWAYSVLFHLTDDILHSVMSVAGRHLKETGTFFTNVKAGEPRMTEPRVARSSNELASATCRVFPFATRTLEFYEAVGKECGLAMRHLGNVKELGFGIGHEGHDNHEVIAFSRR